MNMKAQCARRSLHAGQWLVTGVLACAALSGCGGTTSAPAASHGKSSAGTPATTGASANAVPAQSPQLTAAELKARLLVAADLPGSYLQYTISTDFPTSSSKPACMTILNDLTNPAPPSPPVTQASMAFAASQTGPWIQEVLRSYPGQGAAQAFTATTAVLATCGSFTVSWTAPAETATESVHPLGPVNAGDRSWAASLTVNTQVPVTETLVLVQAGSSLLILQPTSAAGLPTTAQISTIIARAVSKLTSG